MDAHEAYSRIRDFHIHVKPIMYHLGSVRRGCTFASNFGEDDEKAIEMLLVAEGNMDGGAKINLCFNYSGVVLFVQENPNRHDFTRTEFTEENLEPFGPDYGALIREINKLLLRATTEYQENLTEKMGVATNVAGILSRLL